VRVNQKRLRRIKDAIETGTVPAAGWTPPDPKNRSTQNMTPYIRFWKTSRYALRADLGASTA
jgi:hypothetical protein